MLLLDLGLGLGRGLAVVLGCSGAADCTPRALFRFAVRGSLVGHGSMHTLRIWLAISLRRCVKVLQYITELLPASNKPLGALEYGRERVGFYLTLNNTSADKHTHVQANMYTLRAVAHVGSVIDLGLVGPGAHTRHARLGDIFHTTRPKLCAASHGRCVKVVSLPLLLSTN